jgi:hypothetical protein
MLPTCKHCRRRSPLRTYSFVQRTPIHLLIACFSEGVAIAGFPEERGAHASPFLDVVAMSTDRYFRKNGEVGDA